MKKRQKLRSRPDSAKKDVAAGSLPQAQDLPPRRTETVSTGHRQGNNNLIIFVLLGVGFIVTRLNQLTLAGLYYDEAVYLYWGKVIGSDWSQRFIGAGSGGKQPLHSWFVALSERIFFDPIFAGRLVSGVTGAATLLAVWLIANHLFNRRIAVLAALLYILCPFTFLFDRRALTDSLLASEATWILYFSILLVKRQRPGVVIGLAVALGMAMLTKSVGQAFILLLPAALLTTDSKKLSRTQLTRWGVAVGSAVLGGYSVYYFLFGSDPAAAIIPQFEKQYGQFTMGIPELMLFPVAKWWENTWLVAGYLIDLLTIPLVVIGLGALFWLGRTERRYWLLGVWTVLPIVGQIFIANSIFDRYLLFSIPPLLILVAGFLDWLFELGKARFSGPAASAQRQRIVAAVGSACLVLLLLPSLAVIFREFTDQVAANKANSGFLALGKVRDYLLDKAKSGEVLAIVNYSPGPVEDGLAALLYNAPSVRVLRVAPVSNKLAFVDPTTRKIVPKQEVSAKDVYYAQDMSSESTGWLAGHVERIETFSNQRTDDSSIGLYRINLDDVFQ